MSKNQAVGADSIQNDVYTSLKYKSRVVAIACRVLVRPFLRENAIDPSPGQRDQMGKTENTDNTSSTCHRPRL